MNTTNSSLLTGLARKLVQDQLITEETAQTAVTQANEEKISLNRYLINNNIVSSTVIAMASSEEFGLPVFDLSAMDIEQASLTLVNEKLISKHHAVPLFKRGNRLFVAISNPTNMQALDEFKFKYTVIHNKFTISSFLLPKMLFI